MQKDAASVSKEKFDFLRLEVGSHGSIFGLREHLGRMTHSRNIRIQSCTDGGLHDLGVAGACIEELATAANRIFFKRKKKNKNEITKIVFFFLFIHIFYINLTTTRRFYPSLFFPRSLAVHHEGPAGIHLSGCNIATDQGTHFQRRLLPERAS